MPFLSEHFFGIVPFLSYWPQTFTETAEIEYTVLFLGKRSINGNFSKLLYETFMRTMVHLFLPSFMKIAKRKWSNRCVVLVTKIPVYSPFFRAPGTILPPNILQGHSSPPHPSVTFLPNPYSFRGDIPENVFHTHYNIGVKPAVGFSPAIKCVTAIGWWQNTCTGIGRPTGILSTIKAKVIWRQACSIAANWGVLTPKSPLSVRDRGRTDVQTDR